MDNTTTQQPAEQTKRPVVTLEIVRAQFNAELTKLKYQDALQRFIDWPVTSENTLETQAKIKNVRAFSRKLGEIKEAGKEAAWAECKMWDRAFNDISVYLTEQLNAKEATLQTVLDKNAAENKKIDDENKRVEGIKKEIDNFILLQGKLVAEATTTPQLVSIEKVIGSHKANASRYQEFLPQLIDRCNELTPLIKKQKDIVKKMEKLAKDKEAALAKGDDRAVIEIGEKQEIAQHSLDESKVVIQETAIQQALKVDEVTTVTPVQQEVKYRRQSWKWEVKDPVVLYKKAPHLVQLVPDEEKIDELLKTKKADGSLKDVDHLDYMGIRFFLEKKA